MKAIVNTNLLGKELKKMAHVISKNTVLPILSCIKLEFGKGKLTVTATDLETTLSSTINCECPKPFTIVVDFLSISDICNKLNEPVTIEAKENQILIYGDDSKYKIPIGGKESEFPNIPEESFLFTVDVESEFFTSLYSADSCKNPSDLMVRMNTACLDFKKDALTIVGTDALMMYKKTFSIKGAKEQQSLVGGKFVSIVTRLQDGKLSIGEKFIKLESGDTTAITRLQDGKFVDYTCVWPSPIEYNFKANRVDFITALNKASTTANSTTKACTINFNPDKIKITSQDIDLEKEGESNLRATHTVDIEAIGVNSKQLLHILSLLSSEDVDISITSPTRSIVLKPSDDESTMCLLQPIMIG